MKGKQHYKRLPSLDIPTVLYYDVPNSFEALVEEYEKTVKDLKKKYHFYGRQGLYMDRVYQMAKDELGSNFVGCVKPNDVQVWLHYYLKPHEMIITSTGTRKKEVNHAIPIVCETGNRFYAFDTLNTYGQYGYNNAQAVFGQPYPEWFKHLFFVNKHPTQPERANDCSIRAVAWLMLYHKYGHHLIQMYVSNDWQLPRTNKIKLKIHRT